MPQDKFPTPEVNLLSEEDLNTTPQGKFIKWALTWGRRIIVLTELIVILAFLSRFWLDTTVADLNDEILKKKSVVVAMSEFETRYRSIFNRVQKASLIEKSPSLLTTYDLTLKLIPNGVNLGQLSIDNRGLTFNGNCSEETLSVLVENFKAAKEFSGVAVERIAKRSKDQMVDFSLRANYGG